MPQIDCESRRTGASDLAGCCVRLLEAAGSKHEDATLVADTLVESNLRGIDSHGVARLPHYLRRLKLGSINARPRLAMSDLGPATGRVDGDHGLGQLAMCRAAEEAVRLARSAGAGWVAVCNSSHCVPPHWQGRRRAHVGSPLGATRRWSRLVPEPPPTNDAFAKLRRYASAMFQVPVAK